MRPKSNKKYEAKSVSPLGTGWTKEQLQEARNALFSVENGSRIQDESGRRSAGVFYTFGISKDGYMETWLRSVYGRP